MSMLLQRYFNIYIKIYMNNTPNNYYNTQFFICHRQSIPLFSILKDFAKQLVLLNGTLNSLFSIDEKTLQSNNVSFLLIVDQPFECLIDGIKFCRHP